MGSVITLTTDFGLADGYAGVLEGVIAGINPAARIVTISHDVPPQDIAGGRYLLKAYYRFFPPGTVHLGIVDPGVGSRRKIIAVRTEQYVFVGPDNGLFSFIPSEDILSIHSVTNRQYSLSEISPVFHGRDIMAPAAAYLSLGVDPSCLGRKVARMKSLPNGIAARKKGWIIGRIIRVDRFGNLITSIEAGQLSEKSLISVDGLAIGPVLKTFSDVKSGRLLAYVGSGGHLEIAVRNGSAEDYFLPKKAGELEIAVA